MQYQVIIKDKNTGSTLYTIDEVKIEYVEIELNLSDLSRFHIKVLNDPPMDIEEGDLLYFQIQNIGTGLKTVIGGEILRAKKVIDEGENYLELEGEDFSALLQYKTITSAWEDTDATDIVLDVLSQFPEITTGTYESAGTISYSCTEKTGLEVLQDLHNYTGFEFYVTPNKELKWFDPNEHTGTTLTLSDLENYECYEEAHNIVNFVKVVGDYRSPYPENEAATESDTSNWTSKNGKTIELVNSGGLTPKVGDYCLRVGPYSGDASDEIVYDLGGTLDLTKPGCYKKIEAFYGFDFEGKQNLTTTMKIRLYTDDSNYFETPFGGHWGINITKYWEKKTAKVGPRRGVWYVYGSPDWSQITKVGFYFELSGYSDTWYFYLDGFQFTGGQYNATASDQTSQNTWGLRKAKTVKDNSLTSDEMCQEVANAIIANFKDPVPVLDNLELSEGNETLELGKLIDVQIPEGTFTDKKIVKIVHKIDDGDFITTLSLENPPKTINELVDSLKHRIEHEETEPIIEEEPSPSGTEYHPPPDMSEAVDTSPDPPSFTCANISVVRAESEIETKVAIQVSIPRVEEAGGYLVDYRRTDEPEWRSIIVEQPSAGPATVLISDVELGKDYEVHVASLSKLGTASNFVPDPPCVVTIEADTVPPPAPSTINAYELFNGILLEWPEVTAADLKCYNVLHNTINDLSSASTIAKIDATTYLWKVQDPSTDYAEQYFWVSAEDIYGNESDKTGPAKGTPARAKPIDLTIETRPWTSDIGIIEDHRTFGKFYYGSSPIYYDVSPDTITVGSNTYNQFVNYEPDSSANVVHTRSSSTSYYTTYWGVRVFKVDSSGNESEITDGNPVAIVSRTSDGEGVQTTTWSFPGCTLDPTDRICIKYYSRIGTSDWVEKLNVVTPELGVSSLPAQLWRFKYYTKRLTLYFDQYYTNNYLFFGKDKNTSFLGLADGFIKFADGSSKSILRDTDGTKLTSSVEGVHYVYWEDGVSDLQWSTDYSDAVGEGKGLIAIIDRKTSEPSSILPFNTYKPTISAGVIAAKSILAEHIRANQITADHIVTGAIHSDHIAAGQIKSDHIATSQIEAKHIKAGEITAEKLTVGFANYLPDGDFEIGDLSKEWQVETGSASLDTYAYSGNYSLKVTADYYNSDTGNYEGRVHSRTYIPCIGGERFYIRARLDTTNNAKARIEIAFYDQNKSYISSTTAISLPFTGIDWTEGKVSFTAPDNASYFRVYCIAFESSSGVSANFDDIYIRKQIFTEDIDDDAIVASKIAAGEVKTEHIRFSGTQPSQVEAGMLWYDSSEHLIKFAEGPNATDWYYIPKYPLYESMAPQENFIPNQSFEYDRDGDGQPDYWEHHWDEGGSPTYDYVSDHTRKGGKAVKTTCDVGEKAGWISTVYIPVAEGQKYYASVWIYSGSANASGTVYLLAECYDAEKNWINYVNFASTSPPVSSWKQVSGVATIPTNTRYIRLAFKHVNEDGTNTKSVWWDDVTLSELRMLPASAYSSSSSELTNMLEGQHTLLSKTVYCNEESYLWIIAIFKRKNQTTQVSFFFKVDGNVKGLTWPVLSESSDYVTDCIQALVPVSKGDHTVELICSVGSSPAAASVYHRYMVIQVLRQISA